MSVIATLKLGCRATVQFGAFGAIWSKAGAMIKSPVSFVWLAALTCFATFLLQAGCSGVENEQQQPQDQMVSKLVADLIENYGAMGQHVHPYVGSTPVQVNVSFQILHFYGLDENEILEIGIWSSFLWTDLRLSWNSSRSGGVTVIKVPASSIWLPDIGLTNAKVENQFDFRQLKPFEALVFPNGSVYLYYHLVTKVACPMDVTYFPFDSQICRFQFGPWTSYRGSYKIHLPRHKVRMANVSRAVSEWNLVSFGVSAHGYYDDNIYHPWDYFEVHIELRRRPYYYIFVIVVPFFMLSVLACLIFLAEQPGERISLAIAILLTMTIYIMITSSSAPKSMQTIPLIGVYIIAQMALLTLFTFLASKRYPTAITNNETEQLDAAGATGFGLVKSYNLNYFLMSMYALLTIINVCACMVVIPITRLRM